MNNANLWSRVIIAGPDDCWLWSGPVDGFGYGQIKVRGKQTRTHRYSWILENGLIPIGMQINHSCDVPNCVNPAHLKLGTQKDNMRDKVNRNRQAKGITSGYFGKAELHAKGESVGGSKLKEIDVHFIRYWLDTGHEGLAIAQAFNVTNANISAIRLRKTWTHVNA